MSKKIVDRVLYCASIGTIRYCFSANTSSDFLIPTQLFCYSRASLEPKKKVLEAKQGEIAGLQNELSKGSNTMAEAKRLSLQRDIDAKNKSLQRDYQDFNDELEQEQGRLLNALGQRIMVVIDKYAKDNQLAAVVDISSPQTPILWAANSLDITKEVVDLYDKNAPSAVSAAPTAAPTGAVKPILPPLAPKKAVGAPK